jgi:formylglycine-generating enzyme required for sulfatase activity
MVRRLLILIASCMPLLCEAAAAPSETMAKIPAGQFESVLPPAPTVKQVSVKSFRIDTALVSNAQFAAFVKAHPEWQRGRVAHLFADEQYLQHWQSATEPGKAIERQPVMSVSWFAASAYCEAQGKRLPTWYEWEFVAAASDTQKDGRSDPAWRQRILEWYAKPASSPLPNAGSTAANFYGVRDLHGVAWEWVEDHAGMLVAGDNRQQGDPDLLKFCGSGALTMEQKENYATLMRIAMLSSLQAEQTTATMGFRCAAN